MRKTLATLAAAAALFAATATPVQAGSWTTVRSVASSTSPVKVIFRDGGWDYLTPGESSHMYRAQARVIQRAPDVCVKLSTNGGTWKRLTARTTYLRAGTQNRVKAWQHSAC